MNWSPHAVTLRQMQYLLAVSETHSFRRAAERCHVSQPSLSAQIAQAEGALGVRVFERDRRHVLTTAAGEEVLERARAVLIAADDLGAAAARHGDPLAGTLRIGAIPTVSPYLVPEIAPVLRRELPKLRLQWSEDKTATLTAMLKAGAIDAALVALEAELGELEHEVIAEDPFVLAMPKGHILSRAKRPLPSAALDDAELLVLTEGHCLRGQVLSACKRASVSTFGATSLHTLVQMVASGDGVTLLPSLALRAENPRGVLAVRAFGKPVPKRTLALVWRKGSPAQVALRAIAAIVRQVAARH